MAGKRIGSLLLVICLVTLLSVSASAVTIEQVSAIPPEFSIYLYDDSELGAVSESDISAHYDGQPMEVVSFMPATEANATVLYIYALDISASIPAAVFKASCGAVLEAYDKLAANEALALITFGDSVETLLHGGEGRDEVETVLDVLKPDNMNTDFYGAVNQIIELSKRNDSDRKIAVILSDGVDDFYAGFTRAELEKKLQDEGVSINAMCLNGVNGETVSQFGEFARLSGGELFLYDATNAGEKLSELLSRVDGGYVLTLRSANNITDGKAHAITFKLGELPVESVEVSPTVWIKDEEAPKIDKVSYDAQSLTITVDFSEAVAGAAEGAVLSNARGENIKLAGASGTGNTVTLVLESAPYEGDYTLSFSGVTDISMEENPLEEPSVSFKLETGVKEFPRWAYYAIGGGALVIILVVVLILASRSKKKREETEQRLGHLENNPLVGEGGDVGGQIFIPKAEGIRFELAIFDGKGKKYNVSLEIVTSLFIGKHPGNDLVIEDSRISRQHAVIEKLENAIAVQDLNSTNGTFVNGARVQPGVSQRLAVGDELTLGDTTIRVLSVS